MYPISFLQPTTVNCFSRKQEKRVQLRVLVTGISFERNFRSK
jgi:hypothetical protein